MMIRVGILAAALALATPASAFLAHNGQVVEGTGPGQFRVSWSGKSGAPAFWCAAGDYVVRELNLPSSTRIYRYDAPMRRAGESVRFGLSPEGATHTGLLRLGRDPGLSAAFARNFCEGIGLR